MERTVRSSFLDRLIDYEPRRSSDRTLSWEESVRQFKVSVLRDLEWLLNTRRSVEPGRELTPEVTNSIYNYGLPDIGSMGAASSETRKRLVRGVEELIRMFEPRLSNVRASLKEEAGGGTPELHILIHATLEMDPSPEQVAFDTVIDVSTGRFSVEDQEDA